MATSLQTAPGWPPGLRIDRAFLTAAAAAEALATLRVEVPWESHTFTIFGRTVPMPRRIQMFGPHGYAYSGVHHPPRALGPTLTGLQRRIEEALGVPFNSVLANLYRDGSDSMGWHTDDDYPHGGQPAVASLSLGATRRFRLRTRASPSDNRPRQTLSVDLTPGSLLVMDGAVLRDWQHAIPRTRKPVGARINLTWRQMEGP